MGAVFILFIVAAILVGAATGQAEAVTAGALSSARDAVDLAIKLIGVMAFFLGLMEVVKRGGLMEATGRALAPIFRRIFPDVPDGHPALAAITMNMAANMLGLTNAATPFGLKAMRELDRLNGTKGVATDAMCLFLAINTSNVALLPLGTIGLRASLDSKDPAGILLTTLLATACSTAVALASAALLSRLAVFRATRPPLVLDAPAENEPISAALSPDAAAAGTGAPEPVWHRGRVALSAAALVVYGVFGGIYVADKAGGGAFQDGVSAVSHLLLPLVILLGVLYGWCRGVAVYEALVSGAKEGFDVAIRIIPFLVAILVAVGMLRASGSLAALVALIAPLTAPLGFPAEALPMALLRPLSGSGAMGVMVETMRAHGPDSFIGYLVSTIQGSTDTTFYVLAVYGGAIGLRRIRHAMIACLLADVAGIIAATIACHWLIGQVG